LQGVEAIVQSAPGAEAVTAAFSGGILEDLGAQSKLGAVNIEGNLEGAVLAKRDAWARSC